MVPWHVHTMGVRIVLPQKSVVSAVPLAPRRKDGSVASFSLNRQLDKSYVSLVAIPVSPEYLFLRTLRVVSLLASSLCWSRSKAMTASLI